MSDKFEMSGDFQGAILNTKSTLNNVQQSVGDIPTDDTSTRRELKELIGQLNEMLQKAPPDKHEQAEAVAETARALVEQATDERSNKTMIQITGEGLKKAAQTLAEVMPSVITIATQIVLAVGRLTGTGG
jgi:ElaB/YqjD/DUF883 family membrane-anchored ribosome-binding protein